MIKAVISDLGNVLLHFDHRIIVERIARHLPGARWSDEQERHFWPLMTQFETGEISEREFLEKAGVVLDAAHALSEEEFRTIWTDIFWPNTAFIELLAEVRGRVALVMLSNTNPMHIAFARERYPDLFALFDAAVLSYEAGKRKPDEALFHEALAAAGCAPGEAIYFDDIAAYADAASAVGLHGYQYISMEGARDILRMYNVLP